MSKLSKLLTKLFQNRDLPADAEALGMKTDVLSELILAGLKKDRSNEISHELAIKMAELTGSTAHDILKAQIDDQLAAMGVSDKPTKAKKEPKAKKSSSAGTRGCHGPRATFRLD
jgi:hypothetical protein